MADLLMFRTPPERSLESKVEDAPLKAPEQDKYAPPPEVLDRLYKVRLPPGRDLYIG